MLDAPASRLKQAVHRHRLFSRSGALERLFTLWFRGLVYTQIWEAPRVDAEALRSRFSHQRLRSEALHQQDRSAVYGMLHLYVLTGCPPARRSVRPDRRRPHAALPHDGRSDPEDDPDVPVDPPRLRRDAPLLPPGAEPHAAADRASPGRCRPRSRMRDRPQPAGAGPDRAPAHPLRRRRVALDVVDRPRDPRGRGPGPRRGPVLRGPARGAPLRLPRDGTGGRPGPRLVPGGLDDTPSTGRSPPA